MKFSSDVRRLLVVEDNPADAMLIVDMLDSPEVESSDIVLATTLKEALAHLRESHMHAVLLDLRLPDAMGVECVASIRASASKVPIIVLTGLDDDVLAIACIKAGAQDYLPKQDLHTSHLRRAVSHAIARVSEEMERSRADGLQRELAAIVESSPDAIVSSTLSGRVTTWNNGAERTFGYTASEAIGRKVEEVIRPPNDEAARQQAHIAEQLRRDPSSAVHSEVSRLRKDGTALTLSVVSSTVRNAVGEVVGLAAICRDITEQRRLETNLALADRMVSIGTLAAGVAHEINNPLTAVIANLDLALMTLADLPESLGTVQLEVAAELQDAREGADRVRQIVRDLKVFSRSEEDLVGSVNLHSVLNSTIRMAWNEIRHRASLVKRFGEVPPVHGNEARLGQVILNLIVNAVQAIPEGDSEHNEIIVETHTDSEGNAVIAIADTGAGIPDDIKMRLFTAFFTTKPIGEGTGLGLAISQRIVSSFGGRIAFESEVGRGTRFEVILPPASAGIDTVITDVVLDEITLPRCRVLVVDDESTITDAVARMLNGSHEVTALNDADSAIALLRNGAPFDVILCDLMMPQVTGKDFLTAVGHISPRLQARVMFMTGGAFTPAARAFLETIPGRFIEKPFDLQVLTSVILDVVRTHGHVT
ncbi:MAG: response regulator [Gemmatimonadaceae bacterium]|nr:response regulator [Gemmatimonadaceae bacterium]